MKHEFHPYRRALAATTIAVVALLVFVGVVLAATVMVDHFDTGAQGLFGTISVANVPVVLTGTITGGMLGGERDIVITGTSPQTGDNFSIQAITSLPSRLSIATAPSVFVQAHLEWDGPDGNPLSLNPVGLGGVDLTGGGSNNAFHIAILFDDLPVVISLKVYSGTSWSYVNRTLPGGITVFGNRVDFTIPFASFTAGGGGGVNFANVGAIVLDVDTTQSPGADLVLDFLQADSAQGDFGDLPDVYGTLLASNGPRHTITGLRLGNNVDAEANGIPSGAANGDDLDQTPNDEEGVKASLPAWTVAAGGNITVTVNGCTGTCFLNGWIDWNGDGSFAEVGDQVLAAVQVVNGTSVQHISVPLTAPNPFNPTLYARFRLCGGAGGAGNDCNSPTGASASGEVEDYQWGFLPTAVTLESLQAEPTTSPILPVALVGISAAVLIGIVFFTRRGRRKTA